MSKPQLPHKLTLDLHSGFPNIKVECPGPVPGGCQVYEESKFWPTQKDCTCVDPKCQECQELHHDSCTKADRYSALPIDCVAPCRAVPLANACMIDRWMDGEDWHDVLVGRFPPPTGEPYLVYAKWDARYESLEVHSWV